MAVADDRLSPPGAAGQPMPRVSLDKPPKSGRSAVGPLSAPPGWYQASGELRWWDGVRWTEHRAQEVGGRPSVGAAGGRSSVASVTYSPRSEYRTDARANGAEVALAWVSTVLTLGYMLPWAVAATRGKSNSMAIALVNFLVGWTLIGWIVALVMACAPHQLVSSP